MIDAEFESIIRKMANEMGKTIFAEAKFKPLLKDYAKNDFKKDCTLLLNVIDAGCVKYINEAKNLAECKQALIKRLEDDYSLSPQKSGEMLDLLILILRGEKVENSTTVEIVKKEAVAVQAQVPKNDATLKTDSIIPFGNYKWRVLDVQGDEALIITEDIIEKRQYKKEYTDVTWETCDLRKYLNNEFLRKFTKEQQREIAEKRITNPKNLWYGTNGCRDTQDSIFLLSLEEADRYFGNSGDYLNKRSGSYSYYISNNHDKDRVANYEGKACWWWLRSPGIHSNYAADVDIDGDVYVRGLYVRSDYGGVRPALWLKV